MFREIRTRERMTERDQIESEISYLTHLLMDLPIFNRDGTRNQKAIELSNKIKELNAKL